MLSLSYAVSWLGWVAGPLFILIFAAITLYTAQLLADLYIIDGKRRRSYTAVVEAVFGRRGGIAIAWIQYVNLILTAVACELLQSGLARGSRQVGGPAPGGAATVYARRHFTAHQRPSSAQPGPWWNPARTVDSHGDPLAATLCCRQYHGRHVHAVSQKRWSLGPSLQHWGSGCCSARYLLTTCCLLNIAYLLACPAAHHPPAGPWRRTNAGTTTLRPALTSTGYSQPCERRRLQQFKTACATLLLVPGNKHNGSRSAAGQPARAKSLPGAPCTAALREPSCPSPSSPTWTLPGGPRSSVRGGWFSQAGGPMQA